MFIYTRQEIRPGFSNPPFFEDDLRSADARKNKAKHDTGLSLAELLKQANALLSDNGYLLC